MRLAEQILIPNILPAKAIKAPKVKYPAPKGKGHESPTANSILSRKSFGQRIDGKILFDLLGEELSRAVYDRLFEIEESLTGEVDSELDNLTAAIKFQLRQAGKRALAQGSEFFDYELETLFRNAETALADVFDNFAKTMEKKKLDIEGEDEETPVELDKDKLMSETEEDFEDDLKKSNLSFRVKIGLRQQRNAIRAGAMRNAARHRNFKR